MYIVLVGLKTQCKDQSLVFEVLILTIRSVGFISLKFYWQKIVIQDGWEFFRLSVRFRTVMKNHSWERKTVRFLFLDPEMFIKICSIYFNVRLV